MNGYLRNTTGAAAALIALQFGSAAQAKELVYGTGLPAIHPSVVFVAEPLAEEIAEKTNGEVTIKVVSGGALAGVRDTLKAISNGAIDMGLTADHYNPADLPNSVAISTYGTIGKDARVMTAAVNENLLLECENCQNDYLSHDVVPLLMYSTTPYVLMCKDEDILSLASIQGKKVRATGGMGELVAALGAIPVNMQTPDMYEGLQRGALDCVAGSASWLKSYSIWDNVKSVNMTSLGTFHGALAVNMNASAWAGLTDAQRQDFVDMMPQMMRNIAEAYENDDALIIEEAKAKGISFAAGDASYTGAVLLQSTKEQDLVIATGMERGANDPAADVERFIGLVEKWTKIVNEIGEGAWDEAQWDRYQEKAKEEIFSKYKP